MSILRITALLFIFLMEGCDDNSTQTNSQDTSDTYELISMTSGSMIVENTNNTDLKWQEQYVFNNDGTFIKTRTRESKKTTAKGTYTTKQSEDGMIYNLSYEQANPLVGSCTGKDSENLLLRRDGKLQNSWMMCDGPMMIYKKN